MPDKTLCEGINYQQQCLVTRRKPDIHQAFERASQKNMLIGVFFKQFKNNRYFSSRLNFNKKV
jgi:hypothetical protein